MDQSVFIYTQFLILIYMLNYCNLVSCNDAPFPWYGDRPGIPPAAAAWGSVAYV